MDVVLYHLLKEMGHKVDPNKFSLLQTEKSKKNQEEIIEKIFQKPSWKENIYSVEEALKIEEESRKEYIRWLKELQNK